MGLHVVLVEPEIPQNTGNVARTCAATGTHLHLVHPLGFRVDNSAVKRAGLDYWHLVTVHEHPSWDAFLASCGRENLYLFTARASRTHTEVSYNPDAFLVFGRESSGLPDHILATNSGTAVRIPMRDDARCLNLSNAVAVGVYEALRQAGYPGLALSRRGETSDCANATKSPRSASKQ